jgi:hypothetical protein
MATSTRKTPARTSRSKAEVQQEFNEIRKSVTAAQEAADPKTTAVEQQRAVEIREAVADLSAEGVVQRISSLGLEISRALGGISEQLSAEVNRLATVREAVELEQQELGRLHKIDLAATAIDQLVQDHQKEKERLDSEIALQRSLWEEEKEAVERERKELEEAVKKQRQRENEDFEYRKALERKKAQDKYEEDVRLLEKKNREKQEALEKSWQQREAALAEREQELARLRSDAEQFPARLQRETQQAAAQAKQEAERQFEQQSIIFKKDREADQRLAEMQLKTLQEALTRQAEQIADLQKQLSEAKKQVQDIAVKAIEGASGANALSHINQIAMEQAKQRSGQS